MAMPLSHAIGSPQPGKIGVSLAHVAYTATPVIEM
jgi:hypothetical protein